MTEQLTIPFPPLEAQGARRMMETALSWIEDNREGWRYIVDSARYDVDKHRRTRIKRYIEDLRDDVAVRHQSGPVKLQNALSAPFGRILAAWHPELAEYIPMHASKTDGIVIPARPRWDR